MAENDEKTLSIPEALAAEALMVIRDAYPSGFGPEPTPADSAAVREALAGSGVALAAGDGLAVSVSLDSRDASARVYRGAEADRLAAALYAAVRAGEALAATADGTDSGGVYFAASLADAAREALAAGARYFAREIAAGADSDEIAGSFFRGPEALSARGGASEP